MLGWFCLVDNNNQPRPVLTGETVRPKEAVKMQRLLFFQPERTTAGWTRRPGALSDIMSETLHNTACRSNLSEWAQHVNA